jgi:hypothetical protein
MKSVIRNAVRERDTNCPISLQGRGVSHEKCARFIQRHPSFDPTSSPTPCKVLLHLTRPRLLNVNAAINLCSGMDSQAMAAMNSPPEAVEEPAKELNSTAKHEETTCEHDLPGGTDQFPETDLETVSLMCEPGTVVVDDGGAETLEKVAPFRLLPQLDPVDPINQCRKGCKCGVPAPLSEKSSQALVLWGGKQPFNDGELLLCPRYQETLLHVSPWYGSRSVLYFCCKCFMGPQVWQINPCCSHCHALRCSKCTQFSTD